MDEYYKLSESKLQELKAIAGGTPGSTSVRVPTLEFKEYYVTWIQGNLGGYHVWTTCSRSLENNQLLYQDLDPKLIGAWLSSRLRD